MTKITTKDLEATMKGVDRAILRSNGDDTTRPTRRTYAMTNRSGGGGSSPSPQAGGINQERRSRARQRDPQTQYIPPNDFNLPKRVYGPDYTLSWDWDRHTEEGPCECPSGLNLITSMYRGRKYWACISECYDDNASLGNSWNGPNPPFCECNEGFYYSPDNGCKPIPACPNGLVYDYSIEECIRECGPEQVWNRDTERCDCIPDDQGRRRIRSANSGECELVPCNSTYSSACEWNNGNFQASLLTMMLYSWLRVPEVGNRQPTIQEGEPSPPDTRFFQAMYGQPYRENPSRWGEPRVSITNRRVVSRYNESERRLNFSVEPAFTESEIREIRSIYSEVCGTSPEQIKRGVWVTRPRDRAGGIGRIEFQADPNGPCNCFVKPMCDFERYPDDNRPSPTPSGDPYEREPEFAGWNDGGYDPF